MKKIIIMNLLLCFSIASVYSQDYAIDKYSKNISMLGNFTSSGGKLYEDSNGDRQNTAVVSAVGNVFILKNLFIGAGLDVSFIEQANINSATALVGPNLGYAFGDSESKIYPYATSGIRFAIVDNDRGDLDSYKGVELKIGSGVMLPLKKHIGIIMELDYHIINLKLKSDDKSTSGNYFNFNIGVSGLFF